MSDQNATPPPDSTGAAPPAPTPEAATPQVPPAAAPEVPIGAHAAPEQPVAGDTPAGAPAEVLPAVADTGRKSGAAKWIIGGSVALVVAIVAIVVILFSVLRGGDPYHVAVGDCVDQSQFSDRLAQVPDKQTVDCNDKKATHRVVGVVDNQPGSALDNEAVCDAWPQTAGRIWLGEPGKTGKIYCLVKVGD